MARQAVVQVWIEISIRSGHVELLVDKQYYGFWPDASQHARIPDARVGKPGSPMGGGYRGQVRILQEKDFIEYYIALGRQEQVMGKLTPYFHFYEIRTTLAAKRLLRKVLTRMTANPPEYAAHSKRETRNCVTFALDALCESGIVDAGVHVPQGTVKPKQLDSVLSALDGAKGISRRRVATIGPPTFRKRKG